MGAIGHDRLAVPGRVVLAHEPPFTIGTLTVVPPTRQVESSDRSETLEPRVMQALVALYRSGGIVTRDELIERCWDGRVVGEDAINRVISRIRHVAADIGGGSFAVETITKVGYRLQSAEQKGDVAGPDRKPASIHRRAAVAAITATGLLTAGGFALWQATGTSRVPPDARALYDRALATSFSGDPEDVRQSLAYLREAVRISPSFGEAWGKLALVYRGILMFEPSERTAGFQALLDDAIRQARRLDPRNADAEFAALVDQNMYGQWTRNEPVIRSLLRRHPGYTVGHHHLGTLLMDVGRWKDAVGAWRTLKVARPFAVIPAYKLIVSLWSSGALGEAENELDEAMRRWPQHGAIWQTRIKILALSGRPEAALAFASDPATRPLDSPDDGTDSRSLWLNALATRSAPDISRAVDAFVASARNVEHQALPSAITIASLGQADLSLDILEGYFLARGEWSAVHPRPTRGGLLMATHPLFQPHAAVLWSEPRFQALIDRVGLEQYWRASRSLPDYRRQA